MLIKGFLDLTCAIRGGAGINIYATDTLHAMVVRLRASSGSVASTCWAGKLALSSFKAEDLLNTYISVSHLR